MTTQSWLPRVLTFDPPQSSISVERALKNALETIERYCFVDGTEDDERPQCADVAIDDLELLLRAVRKDPT